VTGAATTDAASRRRSATFRSFGNRNYRLYFTGQAISMAGTFMQNVAQGWLVLKLTGSGTALGIVAMLQYLPLLLFGAMAGVIVDRVDRRRAYMVTQTLAGCTAVILGVLTATGTIRLWTVFLLALVLGMITCVDQPLKGALIYDIVGPEDLTNAVGLNQAMNNTGRIIGPAMAGLTISLFGIAPCFFINAASFAAVLIALAMMDRSKMHVPIPQPRAKHQIRDGLTVVRRTPELLAILVMGAVFFGLGWSWDVVMPLVARYTFGGGAGLYGLFLSALGIGAIVGGLATARRSNPDRRLLVGSGIATAVAALAGALAPTVAVEMGVMVLLGLAGSAYITAMSSRIQLFTPSDVRGRVTALWMIAAVGTRPIGAPLVGAVGQHLGPRFAMGMGGVALLLVALPLYALLCPKGESELVVSPRAERVEPASMLPARP
jgi:MFS family permease